MQVWERGASANATRFARRTQAAIATTPAILGPLLTTADLSQGSGVGLVPPGITPDISTIPFAVGKAEIAL
jgi:hypothetical protein